MSIYGKYETYKVVYYPKILNNGQMGVAFIEAGDRSHAIGIFMQQYEGQFSTIYSCEKLFKWFCMKELVINFEIKKVYDDVALNVNLDTKKGFYVKIKIEKHKTWKRMNVLRIVA